MDRLPELSMDLIVELDKIYPLQLPRLTQTEREIWVEVGKREVIEYLLSLKNKQVKRRKLLPGDDEGDDDV